MGITTRARWAFLLSIAALIAVALFAPQLASGSPEATGGGSEPGSPNGGGMAMCIEGVPDCDDMVVVPDGGCGEHMIGTGPDAVVSYTPCPGDDAGAPTDPGDGAQLVEPTPGMADVRARPFDHAVVSDDGRSVTISFWSGIEPCAVLDHVDVAYGRDAITITLFEGHDPSAGDVACIEIAVLKEVVVSLDEPVGDRRIVDGAA
ncbi:MAG TPA: hypothetical protein VF108_06900 [Actinomycetota bacterium]